jgi:hypothetical protein
MHLGYTKNEYGTQVSKHRCDTCGAEFTVCPAVFPESKNWDNCLAPTCSSYDPDRDVDKLLDEGGVKLVPGLSTGKA